ncbi:MAG: DMT family transporter, partial [Fimbriimonadaceae bacterium]|nr:DMT family transporter [Alphaproteobacteria bacterium]
MAKLNKTAAAEPVSLPHELSSQTIWLFVLVALTWGTSWIAIKFQIGVVPQELSVAYRFAISALIMFAVVIFTGRKLAFTRREHVRFLFAGLTMFSFNFLLFYHAANYVVSGFLALVFSLASIFNLFNSWLFLGIRPHARLFLGALLGVAGLAAIFLPSMSGNDLGTNPAMGILLAIIATYSFSLGNIVSSGYRERGIPVYSANAYAMAYG